MAVSAVAAEAGAVSAEGSEGEVASGAERLLNGFRRPFHATVLR